MYNQQRQNLIQSFLGAVSAQSSHILNPFFLQNLALGSRVSIIW
jgi:hypothetical protein